MKLIMQTNACACGQACIAMITNRSIEEIFKVMKTQGPTSIGQLIEALDYYNIKHAVKNVRISKKNPKYSDYSILTVHMPSYTHWVVFYNGKYYDPEFGLLDNPHPNGKVTSFLAINE